MLQIYRKKLYKYLKSNGISKHEFSNMLGVNRLSLYRYLYGKRKLPKSIILAISYLTNEEVMFDNN